LREAERELAELTERRNELEALIMRARAALDEPGTGGVNRVERQTLHDAIAQVLRD
jgi:hypothetical protein